MRCKNCGWENAEDSSLCEKCSSPLTRPINEGTRYGDYQESAGQPFSEIPDEAREFGGTVVEMNPGTPPPFRGNLMGTVSEPVRFEGSHTELQPQQFQKSNDVPQPEMPGVTEACGQCGYPLTGDIHECPYCHTPVRATVQTETQAEIIDEGGNEYAEKETQVAEELPVSDDNPVSQVFPAVSEEEQLPSVNEESGSCPSCGARVPADAKFCLSCGSSMVQHPTARPEAVPRINRVGMGTVRNATVIPGFGDERVAVAERVHYCTLRRREWPGETVRYTPTTYSGDEIVLNRMNTDQNNNTITSKQQAVITCEDGQWYIEDRSALQSTYVRVNGKTPINPGDIILLGNREFEFQGF